MPQTQMIFDVGEMKGPFKSLSAENKKNVANNAAFTLKRAAEIKKDIKTIKADEELLAAAKEILREEITERKTALKT